MLELFSGTGSVGRVAKELGYEVISLDLNSESASIVTDILEWKYDEVDFVPDFIWASPPCDSYSTLNWLSSTRRNDRDPNTAEPFSERAKNGTRILHKTLEIIQHFLIYNDNLRYVIENPAYSMMRRDPKMMLLHNEATSYNLWDDERYKPTRFWSNFNMNLPKPKKPKGGTKKTIRYAQQSESYPIPEKLVRHLIL